MDIEDFVSKVLIELDGAITKARAETSRDITFTSTGDTRTVEFDIAVSAEQVDGIEGKAGVKVLQFIEAGGKADQTTRNSTVSRIRFGVTIAPQTREEEEKARQAFLNRRAANRSRFSLDERY